MSLKQTRTISLRWCSTQIKGGKVFQRSVSTMLLLVAFFSLPLTKAQVGSDWRKRYGPPQAELYILPRGFVMTVFYSEERQTCKAVIESKALDSQGLPSQQSKNSVEAILNEVIPLADRGPQIRSIGLSSSGSGIASVQYERITVGFVKRDPTAADNVASATIRWNGVKCGSPDEESNAIRP